MRANCVAIILTTAVLIVGCSTDKKRCVKDLTNSEIVSIVEAELAKRLGEVARDYDKTVEIQREGCDYVYFERAVAPIPGGWLGVRIDQYGKVIEFVPGV